MTDTKNPGDTLSVSNPNQAKNPSGIIPARPVLSYPINAFKSFFGT